LESAFRALRTISYFHAANCVKALDIQLFVAYIRDIVR